MINLKFLKIYFLSFLLFLTSFPTNAAQFLNDTQLKFSLESKGKLFRNCKHCGTFYLLDENDPEFKDLTFGVAWPGPIRTKTVRKHKIWGRKETILHYKTPEAITYIKVPIVAGKRKQKKIFKKKRDEWLVHEFFQRVQKIFDEDLRLATKANNQELITFIQTVKEGIFTRYSKHLSKQIKFFINLYPDIVLDILGQENEVTRPLLCQYERKIHNELVIHRLKKGASILISIAAVVAVSLATAGIAVPIALSIVLGALTFSSGLADVIINGMDTKFVNKTYREGKKLAMEEQLVLDMLTHLQAKETEEGLTADEEEVLKELFEETDHLAKGRIRHLGHLKWNRTKNRINLAYGTLKTVTGPLHFLEGLHVVPHFIEFFSWGEETELVSMVAQQLETDAEIRRDKNFLKKRKELKNQRKSGHLSIPSKKESSKKTK